MREDLRALGDLEGGSISGQASDDEEARLLDDEEVYKM